VGSSILNRVQIEGAPAAAKEAKPQSLLLDGQQRMTSLYQVALRRKVVETITPKKKKVRRWFYIDMKKALDPYVERDEAIISVSQDKKVTADFGREVVLDLTTRENEFRSFMYPVSEVFDWDEWQDGFDGSGVRQIRAAPEYAGAALRFTPAFTKPQGP
jgi:uncharacterized protein with ParB-like and HNH nuclease domain